MVLNTSTHEDRIYTWDALNRLVTVERVSDNEVIAAYTYDAMNRRIRKVVRGGPQILDSRLRWVGFSI